MKDEYGTTYRPIEELVLGARNDFSVKDLNEALTNGEEILVDYLYPLRTDVDEKGFSLTETYSDGRKKYLGLRNFDADPVGYRLLEIEDFDYEGGTLVGFGTFEVVNRGHLGDGKESWSVIKHVDSGRLFRGSGWYSSWGSGEPVSDWVEVVPVEITVTRFKALNGQKIFDNPIIS